LAAARKSGLFDVARYPQASFEASEFHAQGAGQYLAQDSPSRSRAKPSPTPWPLPRLPAPPKALVRWFLHHLATALPRGPGGVGRHCDAGRPCPGSFSSVATVGSSLGQGLAAVVGHWVAPAVELDLTENAPVLLRIWLARARPWPRSASGPGAQEPQCSTRAVAVKFG